MKHPQLPAEAWGILLAACLACPACQGVDRPWTEKLSGPGLRPKGKAVLPPSQSSEHRQPPDDKLVRIRPPLPEA